jgi:hypothetical protein
MVSGGEMSDGGMIDKERAAHLAEITIFLPHLGAPYQAEEVMEFLAEQRRIIAKRIREDKP